MEKWVDGYITNDINRKYFVFSTSKYVFIATDHTGVEIPFLLLLDTGNHPIFWLQHNSMKSVNSTNVILEKL